MKKIYYILKTLILILFLLFIILFAIENGELIKVNLIFFRTIEIRVFFLIILCFSIGFIAGILTSSYKMLLNFFELLKEKRKNKKLEGNKNE